MTKRMWAVLLTAVLVLGAIVAPVAEAAKKKKKKKPVPVEVTFFFHADEGCAGPLTLMLTEATEGSNCGNNPFYGAGWEVGVAAGLASPYVFGTAEGVPLVLDGTNPVVAKVQISPFVGGPEGTGSGVGEATLVAALNGRIGDETVELATAEATYIVTPAQGIYEVPLEFDVAGFDKATITHLEISLEQRGSSVSHGHYRTLAPASTIAVPTLQ